MKVLMVGPVPPMKGGVSKYCQKQYEMLKKKVDIELVSFKAPYPVFLYRGQMDKADKTTDKKINFVFRWYNPVSWLYPAFQKADILFFFDVSAITFFTEIEKKKDYFHLAQYCGI